MFKEQVAAELSKLVGIEKGDIVRILEKPKFANLGDISFPCFDLAKVQKKSPPAIAMELAQKMLLPPKGIKKVQALGPYVNFFVDKEQLGQIVLEKILNEKAKYGSNSIGKGKTAVIEFSSPNIAKPMHLGHLRSTAIGNSLNRIMKSMGYKTVSINYPGDYGTQFGKLLVAYERWGTEVEDEMKTNPIKALLRLYTKFSIEAESKPELNDEARKMFKLLEDKNKVAVDLWKKFKDLSLKEFKKFYELFGVDFDVYSGESFYNDASKDLVKELIKKKIAIESAGALIVEFPELGSPLIVRKSDGASIYGTRDIAAAIDRKKKYKFDKMIYVVGSEQSLHFKQVFGTIKKMGYAWADDCSHVNYGLIYLPEGKMSTRAGNTVFLEEVTNKIFELTRDLVKNPEIKGKQKELVANAVGISALIYGDLSNDRIKDIKFDWDNILRLEGDSGPYIQYTYARAKSIMRKAEFGKSKKHEFAPKHLAPEEELLITDLSEFPYILRESAEKMAPNVIANYIATLSDHFNSFYEKCPVLKEGIDKETKESRLAITAATAQVLNNGMKLLGMIPLEKM